MEKILDYDHAITPQEKYWDCGPASTQVILSGRGVVESEDNLIRVIGTTTDGTPSVFSVRPTLVARTGAPYIARTSDGDPMSRSNKDQLWADLVRSIDGGFGVLVNWVAPPSNYPKGIKGSASPAYGGGTIYHYVAAMGYDDTPGARAVWIADPGFKPFGYWVSFDQLSTLIPPKGWCFADVEPTHRTADDVMTRRYVSRSKYRTSNEPVGTLADFILWIDARVHERYTEEHQTEATK